MDHHSLSGRAVGSRKWEMQQLMQEFQGLYTEKLHRLDESAAAETEEIIKMKLRIMRSYVADLSEQNEVLAQTIEDIENEANHRVRELERRMSSYLDDRNQVVFKIESLEGEIDLLKQE
uniref:Uncharacterized protein n=2 Tax=Ciona intestinalis TaxID=7719 RepID=F6ZR14_CIOIN